MNKRKYFYNATLMYFNEIPPKEMTCYGTFVLDVSEIDNIQNIRRIFI